jgi:large subunit ribosomal protein L20
MARVKRAQIRKKRIKKLFKRSKGFFLARNNTLRQANEAVLKARMNAYTGRKQKKRQYRSMWIARINAACRPLEISYSQFMHGLNLAGIEVDRKMLSELAIHDADAFKQLVEAAKSAISENLAK